VDAQYLERFAAVRLTIAAGAALAARQVRLDGTAIARADSRLPSRNFQDLHAQFVTQHARKTEERLTASERMKVGPTHADAVQPYERVARPRLRWRATVCSEPTGFEKRNPPHASRPSTILAGHIVGNE
jgi:hypothetical protein